MKIKMNNTKPTIWMNATTSVNWNRPPVGIVRVEQILCRELANLYPNNQFKQCVWQDNKFIEYNRKPYKLNHTVLSKFYKAVNRIKSKLISSMVLSKDENKQTLPKTQKEIFNDGDVFISVGLDWEYPYYKQLFCLKKQLKIKIITFCHDLIPILYPQYCLEYVAEKFPSYLLDLAEASDLILCNSKQTERDLKNFLEQTGGAYPQTCVITLGDNIPYGTEAISDNIIELSKERFILFVSSIERRKNHEVLFRAYQLFCQDQDKCANIPKLICVGMPGWGIDHLLKEIAQDLLVKGFIIQLNHVNDAELRLLYESALFCVYPSLYEGWGLPVGEALAMGKLVLSSNRGALPEVGGDLVLYIDPLIPQDWAEAIWRMTIDDSLRNALIEKVRNNYKIRTWGDTAKSIKQAIDELFVYVGEDVKIGDLI
jgi:glycosyltransferase involved in cell wall biosynthesis